MDDEPSAPPAQPAAAGGLGGLDDLFGGPAAPAAPASTLKVTLPADKGDGMQIRSAFVKKNGQVGLDITVENQTMGPLSGFAIQFNKNSFGLTAENPAALGQCLPPQIAPGASGSGFLPLVNNPGQLSDSKGAVQMAIKTNVKVSYLQDVADVVLFLTPDGKVPQQDFLAQWKGGAAHEHRIQATGIPPTSEVVEQVCPKFEASQVFFIARRKAELDFVYFSAKTFNNMVLLAEVGFQPGSGSATITVKSAQPQYVPLFAASIEKLLKA